MNTLDHKKVKNPARKHQHNFISYFQSVTTIGVISQARNSEEAEAHAAEKLKNSDLTCGLVGQTPFILSATEEWTPDISGLTIKPTSLAIDIKDDERFFIAEMLHKKPDELSSQECSQYIKGLLEQRISNKNSTTKSVTVWE
jgi:hypothetical protein